MLTNFSAVIYNLLLLQILKIEGLSVYWNSQPKESFLELSQSQLYSAFKKNIVTNNSVASDNHYSKSVKLLII